MALRKSAQAKHPLPHAPWEPPQERRHHRVINCHGWHQRVAGKEAAAERRTHLLNATTVASAAAAATAAAGDPPSSHGHQPKQRVQREAPQQRPRRNCRGGRTGSVGNHRRRKRVDGRM